MIKGSKKAEKEIERISKLGLKWYAIVYNINGKRIDLYNIFNNYNFLWGIAQAIDEYKSFKEFKEQINSWLMYSFWSKREFEIVCGDLFVEEPDHLEKIDVYYQVKDNVEILSRYILDEYNKHKRKKIGE